MKRLNSVSVLIQLACWLTLLNMGMQIFALLMPKAIPIMFAMSAGPAVGAASLAAFVGAIYLERRALLGAADGLKQVAAKLKPQDHKQDRDAD